MTNEKQLLQKEAQTKNQAKIIQIIEALGVIESTEIEVDEERVHLSWKGKDSEFIDILFNKGGKVSFINDETPTSFDIEVGSFIGESLYNYITKRECIGR